MKRGLQALTLALLPLAGCASPRPTLESCAALPDPAPKRSLRLQLSLRWPEAEFPLRLDVVALEGVSSTEAKLEQGQLVLKWVGPHPTYPSYERRFDLERIRKTESRKRGYMVTAAGKVLTPQ